MDIFALKILEKMMSITPFYSPFTSSTGCSPTFCCRALFLLLCCGQKFGQQVVVENKEGGKTTMSTQRSAYQIKKGGRMVIGMLLGLIIGLALDNIPIGYILGLNFGIALNKYYR